MQQNDKPVLVYSTFPTAEEAEAIAGMLIEQHLAACVNILGPITSIYRWEGKVARDREVAVIVKTRSGLVDAAMAAVKERHSYANPALLVIPVEGGAAAYLGWLMDETQPPA